MAAGLAAVLLGGGLPLVILDQPAAAADPCAAPVTNPVACENTKPGDPSSEWDVDGSGDGTIEGFTTDFSVNVGQTVRFKIKTVGAYTMDIYRVGYYQGNGARKVASVTPTQRTQPNCVTGPDSGLIDCGNWLESASWAVPSTAVSGVYFARIARSANPAQSNHVVFVVRNDASQSDLLFQTSDTTWQAYNDWGGNSLYSGTAPAGRAYKVSYNRPFRTRVGVPWGRDFLFANEYPMIRFLERNGYDLSYFSGIDTDRNGSLLTNHKAFLSVGHDEYWSGQQRANVEAARDAGVNLAFFSGNEVFWKTRWENSIDGSGAAHRTLVTYKETHANAKIDPAPVSTGTWRDPRFGPDGGKPENGLTGTIWTVNCCSYPMKVPAADGKMRFWRNTSIATMSSGTATLPNETLGYEWDEDLDNGARPRGLFHMSTTTENVEQYAQGFGSTVAPGTATHHLTMYKAPSGARVFGAGTVQWSWGLDDDHDGTSVPVDIRMQQATVNLFADMGVQPFGLQAGLVPASASADSEAPQSNVSSPAPNAQFANGSTATITGTASELGGGRVGGVEVSTDGGTTWHPAVGRDTWTYSWKVTGNGAVTIKTRAVDDSGNVENPGVGTTVNVSCPCSVFGQTVPPGSPADDPTPLELGMRFRPTTNGWVTGVRFYKGTGNTGTHLGHLWTNTGTLLATATFSAETATGWQSVQFPAPVQVNAGTTYVVSYYAPNGRYYGTGNYFFADSVNSPPLTALRNDIDGPNGVYTAGASAFPTNTYAATNYWVDVTFDTVAPPDDTKPAVLDSTPLPGSSSVPTSAKPAVTFSENIQQSSLSFVVRDPGNNAVAGSVAYNATTRVATFTPSAALAAGTKYTVTVSGAQDQATPTPNVMDPHVYSFTTAKPTPAPGVCPCSIWNDSTVPETVSVDDPSEVELGVKFSADKDGFIDGIRFYKGPKNTGTHTGTLWSLNGAELATATFSAESTAGWQEVTFSTPVAVTAGTVYVASYHTTTGWYSATGGIGLNQAVVNPPLTALANGQNGPNGVYRYGARGFPTSGAGAGYYVDVVFRPPNDTGPPQVASTSPAAGATSVQVSTKVSATFNENLSTAGTFTVQGPGGAAVAGSAAYDPATRTNTFTPASPLAVDTTYTATVGGAKDTAGNTMAAPHTWSFKTSGLTACPCTIFPSDATPVMASANDTNGVELGVKFTADVDGHISGIRFYKGAGNTGVHTGHLWTASGTLLGTANFAVESATGWQSATFPAPVAVTAGTTYVASYYAPNGGYAVNVGYFAGSGYDNAPLHALSDSAALGNGVFRYGGSFPNQTYSGSNYWVDVTFAPGAPPDNTAPTVQSTTPVNGQTSVPVSNGPTATFDEPVQAPTVQFTLTGPGGSAVTGTVGYDAATKTAQFSPAAALAYSTTYTAQVSGAKDVAGNTMAGTHTWSFTTAAPPGGGSCPCSIWPDSATPANPDAGDPGAVEIGTKFRADADGYVTGVRFYKSTANTGSHVGHLWTTSGTLLGAVAFSNESAAGWQQATFASPIAVTANTTYVVSYHAPNGHYAATINGFAAAGVDTPPLHALRSGVDGGNGVYAYGPSAFPGSGTDHNYWVDVVFNTTLPTDTTPPTVQSTVPADASTGVAPTATPSAVFSEPVQPSTVQMTLTGPGATTVNGSVSYDAATRTGRFTPAAALAYSTTYTARVTGARDEAGNPIATTPAWSFTTAAAPDTTAPTVSATDPANAATQIGTNVAPRATFSEPVQAATVQMTLTRAGGTAVTGTVSYDGASRTARFTPAAALAGSTSYTARVSGAMDTAGNTMTAVTWSFTTTTCPCTIWAPSATPANASMGSSRAIEPGVKFRADVSGVVNGIRFYKGTGNTGTHLGHLWTRTGTLLGTATFTSETATGWQQVTFSTPIAITANTTYIASYWAPAGRWAGTLGGLTNAVIRAPLRALASGTDGVNGVYRYDSSGFPTVGANHNYWVDVVFTPTSPPPPLAGGAALPSALAAPSGTQSATSTVTGTAPTQTPSPAPAPVTSAPESTSPAPTSPAPTGPEPTGTPPAGQPATVAPTITANPRTRRRSRPNN